jgi:hypothetical protein
MILFSEPAVAGMPFTLNCESYAGGASPDAGVWMVRL